MTRITLEIERLGQRGEGVAKHSGRLVFVPFALEGERALVEIDGERGRLVEILSASPDRVAPICQHYGVCGGCAVQTLVPSAYAAWKRELVVAALSNAGISANVAPLLDAHGAGRRRVVFHARNGAVGFMEARAHKVVEIDACPLLESGLEPALDAARALARPLKGTGKPFDIAVTATLEGLDVDLRGSGALAENEARALVALAERLDLARLSNHGRILALRRRPMIDVGKAKLSPPPGGFLQATAQGEEEMGRLALQSIGKAKRVADLFCGSGAFALRLADVARVEAFDENAEALAALQEAARTLTGTKPIDVRRRNLFDNPLRADELERLRRRRLRSAARRRRRAGRRARPLQGSGCGRRLLQRAKLRARRKAYDRRGIYAGAGHADRPVPLCRPYRARCGLQAPRVQETEGAAPVALTPDLCDARTSA